MKERANAARTGMKVKARNPGKFGRMNVQPIRVLRRACFRLPRPGAGAAAGAAAGVMVLVVMVCLLLTQDFALDTLAHLGDSVGNRLLADHDEVMLLVEDL